MVRSKVVVRDWFGRTPLWPSDAAHDTAQVTVADKVTSPCFRYGCEQAERWSLNERPGS